MFSPQQIRLQALKEQALTKLPRERDEVLRVVAITGGLVALVGLAFALGRVTQRRLKARRERRANDARVEQASMDSFPASDAPGF